MQPLTGSAIERDILPTPVVDEELDSSKCLRVGYREYAFLFTVGGDLFTFKPPSAVLAPYPTPLTGFCVEFAQCMKYLHLSVSDFIGLETHGRLHSDQAEQLQQVVLHHIAQRACFVVIPSAVFHTELFGHRDLYMLNVVPVPEGFEHGVREPEGEKVLYRLLSEVVIDAIDLVFRKDAAQQLIQRACRFEVVTERFLYHDARF